MFDLIPALVLAGRRAARRDKFNPVRAVNPHPLLGRFTLSSARQSWNYGWNDKAWSQPQPIPITTPKTRQQQST